MNPADAKAKCTYVCPDKRCPRHGIEFQAPSPAVWRAHTGRYVECDQCGQPVRMVLSSGTEGRS